MSAREVTDKSLGLGGIFLGLGVSYFGAYNLFKLPVVLPVLLETFHYDRTLAGGFMSVYALMGLLLSVWIGRITQRRGALFLVPGGLGLLVVAAITTLAFPHWGWLVLLARAVEGAAFAVFAISGPVLANASATERQLPIVIGFTAMWIPIGQLSASLVAPIALHTIGWQLLWYVGIAATAAFGLLLWRIPPRFRKPPSRGAASSPANQPLGATERSLLITTASVFMIWSGQYFAYMTWLPQYLVEVRGTDIGVALLGYVIPVVLVALFNLVTGFALRARIPAGWLMSAAMLAQATGWWLIPFTDSAPIGLGALFVYGVAAGIVPACLFAMPSVILGAGRSVADAFGIIMTGRNLGVMFGPVLLALTFQLTGSWDLGVPIFGTLTLVCFALCVRLSVNLHHR